MLSFTLFYLKIIGGSDGKLIILIFTNLRVKFLSLDFVFCFFLIFSLLIICLFFLNYLQNSLLKEKDSFIIFFNSTIKLSVIERIFIKGFFKFSNFINSDDSWAEKNLLKSLFLIYNSGKNKTQILIQFRPPLIILVILSYFTLHFLKLAV